MFTQYAESQYDEYDQSKDIRKMRARISFNLLRQIADWRVKEITVK